MDWQIWQFADSSFPIGGFAHSAGLEAAWRAGFVDDAERLEQHCGAQLRQWTNATAPVALWAWSKPWQIAQADELCDLVLNHPIGNRASRAQGRALLLMARQIYPSKILDEWHEHMRTNRSIGHFSPIFGAVCQALGIGRLTTSRLYLFMNLRGVISAAVRLGIVGPLAAQAIQYRLAAIAEQFAQKALQIQPDEAAQASPLADLLAGSHDRLYSRLFQS